MAIFKKVLLLIATLAVTLLPFGFSVSMNSNQTRRDLFGKGQALLLGVAFAADVVGRCFIQTKDRPTRLIIGLLAALICLAELPFYGYASGMADPLQTSSEGIAFWSLIALAGSVVLQIAVILAEEL